VKGLHCPRGKGEEKLMELAQGQRPQGKKNLVPQGRGKDEKLRESLIKTIKIGGVIATGIRDQISQPTT